MSPTFTNPFQRTQTGGVKPAPVVVAITSPTAGASVTAGAPVTITGTISDSAIIVQVKLGSTVLGSASIAGLNWSFTWTPQVGDAGAQTLGAAATSPTGDTTQASGVNVTVVVGPTGTDFAALAVANSLTVVGYFRADYGVTGTAGSGKASWANLSGGMSAITPDGTATNGIGSVSAGLGGRAGLILDASTQMGQYTAPTLAAPGTTNWHRYWIARQATGASGGIRKVMSESGDAYKIEFSSTLGIAAYGCGVASTVTNDVWQRGRTSYTGSGTSLIKIGNLSAVSGGSATNTAPATARTFGSLLLNWEWLMYIELTGTLANMNAFQTAADAAAQTTWTNAIQI